jgi:hypothetical protein
MAQLSRQKLSASSRQTYNTQGLGGPEGLSTIFSKTLKGKTVENIGPYGFCLQMAQ